jgi:hypothetical protein
MSDEARAQLETRVWADNLRAVVDILAAMVRYDADADDWAAIEAALPSTDATADSWLDYPLVGERLIGLELAGEPRGRTVVVRLDLPASLLLAAETALAIAQSYELRRREPPGEPDEPDEPDRAPAERGA